MSEYLRACMEAREEASRNAINHPSIRAIVKSYKANVEKLKKNYDYSISIKNSYMIANSVEMIKEDYKNELRSYNNRVREYINHNLRWITRDLDSKQKKELNKECGCELFI